MAVDLNNSGLPMLSTLFRVGSVLGPNLSFMIDLLEAYSAPLVLLDKVYYTHAYAML